MDLNQRKLTKSEWESIEVPVSSDEIEILKLINQGYSNVNYKYNKSLSTMSFLKIDNSQPLEDYLFNKYFNVKICNIAKKYNSDCIRIIVNANPKIKTADKIRMDKNTVEYLEEQNVFEYTLIDFIEKIIKYKSKNNLKWEYYYFTLHKLISYSITNLNRHILNIAKIILIKFEEEINIPNVIKNAVDFIEKNDNLLKYSDIALYEHQKTIFTISKKQESKLILYIAPTGTGKTLTPIGLSEGYKIIFVCAARHVGLALARAAISVHKKIAFAFGCSSADDIRLHYFSAKEYSVNRKSGGIWKVDNSIGDKVEIMICDIKSYLPAMYYMLAFNKKEQLLTYWDEPTITMDYETHEFHEIIKQNWKENTIPNMVLSSATLPQQHEITETINDFKTKFPEAEVYNIVSHDCKKSISLIDKSGYVVLPHYLTRDHDELKNIVSHCESYLTILRYFDLKEVVKFISYMETTNYIPSSIKIARQFGSIQDIDMISIKMYYLKILNNIISGSFGAIALHFTINRERRILDNNSIDIYGNYIHKSSSLDINLSKTNTLSGNPISRIASEQTIPPVVSSEGNAGIYVTTKDSHTLTDGPSMFLTNNVEKVAKFCIQQANIPSKMMEEILEKIHFNNTVNDKISKIEKDLEDILERKNGSNSDATSGNKNHKFNRTSENETEKDVNVNKLTTEVNMLRTLIKTANLNETFVPNKLLHIKKWAENMNVKNAFTSNIDDDTIQKIMLLNKMEDSWKVLLLMGIGVFTNHENIAYTEIMKKLADEQKLYMIIACSDFVYGTNYQCCHGYLSKDLNLTQEKIIQSMGRIGRNNLQQEYTIRFRDNDQIYKLFTKELDKPEVRNMNLLFNSN